jgi:predicted regulator of Ras-like GTPase activity (Roadblock/LC7/MglB family)
MKINNKIFDRILNDMYIKYYKGYVRLIEINDEYIRVNVLKENGTLIGTKRIYYNNSYYSR